MTVSVVETHLALDKRLGEKGRLDNEDFRGVNREILSAPYKIQVLFGKDRTSEGPNIIVLTVYMSGRWLNGEGDAQAFWCMEKDKVIGGKVVPGRAGCGRIIPPWHSHAASARDEAGKQVAVMVVECPWCGGSINGDNITDARYFRASTRDLADIIAHAWDSTEGKADIYMKHSPGDLRVVRLGNVVGMEKARELRGLCIYPLAHIFRDTGAGKPLRECFYDFLRA